MLPLEENWVGLCLLFIQNEDYQPLNGRMKTAVQNEQNIKQREKKSHIRKKSDVMYSTDECSQKEKLTRLRYHISEARGTWEGLQLLM